MTSLWILLILSHHVLMQDTDLMTGDYDKLKGPCVFGDSEDCFFQCNCATNPCNDSSPRCQSCDPLTGECLGDCNSDNLTLTLYSDPYWNGPGCQVGNIACGKPSRFEDGQIIGALFFTDGSLESANRLTFEHPEYWLIDLLDISKVKFIDFIIKPQVREFKDNLRVSLVTRSSHNHFIFQNITRCVQRNNVAKDRTLVKDLPYELLRIHYTCTGLSVGNIIKIKTRKNVHLPFDVAVSEVVVIGHRYLAPSNTVQWSESCIEKNPHNFTTDLQWCVKCNNSLPPLCTEPCPPATQGINCQQAIIPIRDNVTSGYMAKPNIVVLSDEQGTDILDDNTEAIHQPFFTISNIIVISVFSLLILFILMSFIVWIKLKGGVRQRTGIKGNDQDNVTTGVPVTELLHLDTSPPAPPAMRAEQGHQYCEIDEIATPTECLLNRASIGGMGRFSAMGLSHFPYNTHTIAPPVLNKHYSLNSDPGYLSPVSSKMNSSYLSIIPGSTEDIVDNKHPENKEGKTENEYLVPRHSNDYLVPRKTVKDTEKVKDTDKVKDTANGKVTLNEKDTRKDTHERAHSIYDNLL